MMGGVEKVAEKARNFRQREQTILNSALALFLSQGEERVTVDLIADEAGVGKGTVYKHFASKYEIYLRLMLDYEEELAALFQRIDEACEREQLPREYFRFRMRDPAKYRLFDRLEQKCIEANAAPDLLARLHRIRASNLDKLTDIIARRISEGKLEDVPPYYHYCAAWALVHGAVALYYSDFYNEVIEDKDDFFEFLMDIGVRMGNKGQRKRREDSSDHADSEAL